MRRRSDFELPAHLQPVMARAQRLEWVTIAFLVSIIVLLYFTMGSSQSMKAAWVEDILSLVPPAAFLVSARFRHRRPDRRFPYGYHRSVSIAFLTGAASLAALGAFMVFDSVGTLLRAEHPSIGTMDVFGHAVWAGWVMMAALAYSAIPPFVLGRMKLEPARLLHDKTLKADADMNRADWATAGAGIVGLAGIGLGWWWADGVAGALISVSILHDGLTHLKRVVADLMDAAPTTVEGEPSALPEQVLAAVREIPWVVEAEIRMREEGHVMTCELFLRARGTGGTAARIEEARGVAREVDWRVHDVVVEIAS